MIRTSRTRRVAMSIGVAATATVASMVAFPSASLSGRSGTVGSGSAACATLRVHANPPVNAQNSPFEKIKNTVTSCAKSTETVTLTQHIIGPFAPRVVEPLSVKTWTITLAPIRAS